MRSLNVILNHSFGQTSFTANSLNWSNMNDGVWPAEICVEVKASFHNDSTVLQELCDLISVAIDVGHLPIDMRASFIGEPDNDMFHVPLNLVSYELDLTSSMGISYTDVVLCFVPFFGDIDSKKKNVNLDWVEEGF